jgi:hypothetical protein
VPAASGKYDCREKVPNIYFVNVKVDGKYDCREKVPNIYEVNVKAIFPTIVGKRGLRLRDKLS